MLKSLNQLYIDRMAKGGPGSGRYPKGSILSEDKLTYQEKLDYDKLSELSKKDYLEHRGAGMDHETAIILAEPDVAYARKMLKNGQNAYAQSGVMGATVRETHPELDTNKKCPKCGLLNCRHNRGVTSEVV